MATKRTRVVKPVGSPAYRRMVAAVRAYLTEVRPDANLIDICDFDPCGSGRDGSIAQFHADPDSDGPHDEIAGDGTRANCPHCRGDRKAEGK